MSVNYEYGTSPKKVLPEYTHKHKDRKKQIKQKPVEKTNNLYARNIALIVGVFFMLLVVSYRNSLITEKFKEIQNSKAELASIQKINEQLEVSIEGSLNLENVEKEAEEQLNLQKLDNNQKVYITLPKKDYTEVAIDEIKLEEDNKNVFEKIINKILGE